MLPDAIRNEQRAATVLRAGLRILKYSPGTHKMDLWSVQPMRQPNGCCLFLGVNNICKIVIVLCLSP